MSASREKKKRQNQPEVTAPVEAPKKGMSKGLKRTLAAVVAVVLVAAIVFLALVSTGFFTKHSTLAVVNGHKLTPAMTNYFYADAYQQLQNYGIAMNTEVPLSEQPYGDEGQTWADYIIEFAVSSAADVYAIYDAAVAEGFALEQADLDSIDSQIQMMDLYASYYGYADGNAFIAAQYGAGCTKSSYREYLTVNTLANKYAAQYQESLSYTADEIEAYYAENTDNYDRVTFRYFSVNPTTIGQEETDAGMKACEATAKEMAESTKGDEQAYIEKAQSLQTTEGYDAESATLREAYTLANCADTYRDWLKDSARQEGDTTYVNNNDTGYIVLYYVGPVDDYQMPNVRHILISAADTSDEAAMAEAKAQAEAVLAEYEAGEKTEDAFAALAQEHSADNAEAGGLYENVEKGRMVEPFETWCYDESRQVGDTGIVETEFGYHIMYFVGYGRYYYTDFTVENDMRYNDASEWSTGLTENATFTINDGAKRWLVEL